MTHPTDADVEAMARAICRAIGVPENALCAVEGEPLQPCWQMQMPKARAGLMALPHYLRAVEEREGLIEALEAYEREREDMEDRAPTYPECIECNLGTGPHKRTCAHHLARAILSRAQAPTPEEG